MDEILEDVTNGGERFIPGISGRDLALEHWHRYAFACQFAAHRRVADIACGDGYGAALLSRFADSVIGIDRNPAIIDRARSKYRNTNLRFVCADAEKLPLADSSIDVIISCETLEHVSHPPEFISEVRRILVPAGVFVVSTPNPDAYARTRAEPNPHHVSEMRPAELAGLLSTHFAHVRFCGQRIVFGSAISSLPLDQHDNVASGWLCTESAGQDSSWFLTLDDLSVEPLLSTAEPTYLLAVASAGGLPELGPTFMEYKALFNPAASLLGGIRERDQRVRALERALAETNARLLVKESDAADAVRKLFDVFLGRGPTEAEQSYFTSTLMTSGSLSQLINTFCQSAEFVGRNCGTTKLFVPPGHFYSPIVCPSEIESEIPRIRPEIAVAIPDVHLDIETMTRFWETNLAPIVAQNRFPADSEDGFRFRFNNPAFSYADALVLQAMVLHFRPSRIIEVGSGWSTACILDTLSGSGSIDTMLTCIEPHPELLNDLIWPEDKSRIQVIPRQIQKVDMSVFGNLKETDILFIDSTHVVKTGSDVVFEISNILPILPEGVIIHFHDIFYPFEYGYNWAVEENRSWNEIYALRYFLAFNNDFEVIFFNDMFAQLRRDLLQRDCPKFLMNSGGSIWLRRRS